MKSVGRNKDFSIPTGVTLALRSRGAVKTERESSSETSVMCGHRGLFFKEVKKKTSSAPFKIVPLSAGTFPPNLLSFTSSECAAPREDSGNRESINVSRPLSLNMGHAEEDG